MNGLSYSKFIFGMNQAGIILNRKVLAEMAVHDFEAFKAVAVIAKEKAGVK